MTIQEQETKLIEDFSLFDTWDEKYEYIIELGKKLPPLNSQHKTETYKIKGCQSNVWLYPEIHGEKLEFKADSDSVIVKGLIALLIYVLSGQPAADIYKADLSFMEKIGLMQHLAPTRSNGLLSMVKQIKLYALALKSTQADAQNV